MMNKILRRFPKGKFKIDKMQVLGKTLTVALVLFALAPAFAQAGGGAAISSAAGTIKGYKTAVVSLIYAVALIVGIVGGVRIYNKWTNGDQDINKEIIGWGGAAIFLALMPEFISAIFP